MTGSLIDFIGSKYDLCFCIVPNYYNRYILLDALRKIHPDLKIIGLKDKRTVIVQSKKIKFISTGDLLDSSGLWRGYSPETTCIWSFSEYIF